MPLNASFPRVPRLLSQRRIVLAGPLYGITRASGTTTVYTGLTPASWFANPLATQNVEVENVRPLAGQMEP